jgi:hypothetical protein
VCDLMGCDAVQPLMALGPSIQQTNTFVMILIKSIKINTIDQSILFDFMQYMFRSMDNHQFSINK